MFLRAQELSKSFSGTPVLRGVTLQADQGDSIALIGPSGVGKTTLLKILAGLEQPDSGTLEFDKPPTRQHPAILVFQDYLLFPNLTVQDNVAFGLRARKLLKATIRQQVSEYLDHFHIKDLAKAYPATLSAGQRQRVALARAMVVKPALLLLDEPFANLDRNLKLETAEFIRATQKEFGVTTITVTHDQEEAFVMSDTVGIMLDGRLAQVAPAQEVYSNPANIEVASFLGPVNKRSPELADMLGQSIDDVPEFIRPEQLDIRPDPTATGRVVKKNFAGHHVRYTVRDRGATLIVFTTDSTIQLEDRVRVTLGRIS